MKTNPYRRDSRPLNANMNVVPYIDVMLVLLVIFMVTTPMLTTGIDVDLPKEKTNTIISSSTQLPVIVSLNSDGSLFVSYENSIDQPIHHDELITLLVDLQKQSQMSAGQPLQVMINADKNNSYGSLVQLMASLQQAGIEKVGLLTSSPLPNKP